MQHGKSGIAFENETRDRMRTLGWHVETTPVTGDYGADLIARLASETLVIQCKDYGCPAGVSSVQEAHFAKTHYGATAALVIARNGFTKAAIRAALTSRVDLLRPNDLILGSNLDRTPARREIERRERESEAMRVRKEHYEAKQEAKKASIQAGIEAEKQKSLTWRIYDRSFQENKKLFRRRFILKIALIAVTVLFVANTILISIGFLGDSFASSRFFEVVFLVVLLTLLSRCNSSNPIEPLMKRKGFVLKCGRCSQSLRVDYGRDGLVRCPQCSFSTPACTRTLNVILSRCRVERHLEAGAVSRHRREGVGFGGERDGEDAHKSERFVRSGLDLDQDVNHQPSFERGACSL